jgi:hypothetical protein
MLNPISEGILLQAHEKIKENFEINSALDRIQENLQLIFDTVLEDELNYDEISALVEQRLEAIYIDFAEGQDEIYPA